MRSTAFTSAEQRHLARLQGFFMFIRQEFTVVNHHKLQERTTDAPFSPMTAPLNLRKIHSDSHLSPFFYLLLLPQRAPLVSRNAVDGTPDSSCELKVFGHDCDSLGMDGTQIAVFKEMHEKVFRRFLDGEQAFRRVPKRLWRHLVGDLPHQATERCFPNEQLSALLELPDFL